MLRKLTEEDYRIAESNGISRRRAYQRYNQYNQFWTKEDAISKPVYRHESVWRQYKELAEKHGIKRTTFLKRINVSKLSPEEAATRPLDKRGKKSGVSNRG